MGQIKILNSFKNKPLDDGNVASAFFYIKKNDFASQSDIVFDNESQIQMLTTVNFASQSDLVFDNESQILI